jgi:hypothetical protein
MIWQVAATIWTKRDQSEMKACRLSLSGGEDTLNRMPISEFYKPRIGKFLLLAAIFIISGSIFTLRGPVRAFRLPI